MCRKRRNTSSPESDSSPPPKRSRSVVSNDDEGRDFDYPQISTEQPRLNPTSGLQNAFPGLGEDGDELFYGPAVDGLEYLRMVRSEAKGVPNLLLASLTSKTHPTNGTAEDIAQEGLIYFDGTYTAATRQTQIGHSLSDCQQEYYKTLLDRFQWLRDLLGTSPPLGVIQLLDASRPITCPPGSQVANDAWIRHMLTHDPHPAQIASIDPESVQHLVSIFTPKLGLLLRNSSTAAVSRVGSWIWALLARCPDRGELSSDEIAELRAFAARAVNLLGNIGGKETISIDEDNDDNINVYENQGAHGTAPQALATKAKGRMQSIGDTELDKGVAGDTPLKPAAVILDTVITIVGEFYGQRDLLEHRVVWVERQKASLDALEMDMVEQTE